MNFYIQESDTVRQYLTTVVYHILILHKWLSYCIMTVKEIKL